MKFAKIIIFIFFLFVITACEDKNIFPHPNREPIKPVGMDIKLGDVFAMPDGRAAAFIKLEGKKELEIPYAIAIIDRNGHYTLSDTIFIESFEDDYTSPLKSFSVSMSNDIYVIYRFFLDGDVYTIFTKIDGDGHEVYQQDFYMDEVIDGENFSFFLYDHYQMLNNGDLAIFNYHVSCDENCECTLYFADNYERRMFEYQIDLESEYCFTDVFSFEDKIILYNGLDYSDLMKLQKNGEYEGINCKEYKILNIDGTIGKSGESQLPIQYFKYVDGSVYMVTGNFQKKYTNTTDTVAYQWFITKMDAFGNIVYTTDEPIKANSLLENITIENGTLMIPGLVLNDDNEKNGAIFLIDDNVGKIKEQIVLNYSACSVMPCVISPDGKGEYDIFALVYHEYDNPPDKRNSTANTDGGKVYVYHTDDLHKFQIND